MSTRRTLRLWGTAAVVLWTAHLAAVVLLPDAVGARTAPHPPPGGMIAFRQAGRLDGTA